MGELTLEAVGDEIDELIEAMHAGFRAIPLPGGVEPHEVTPFAFALRDDRGRIEGGVTGQSVWGWLYVHYLWVAEARRGEGHGARLMAAAEIHAETRGCIGVWVSTYSFQAGEFYEKLGYVEFGRIADFPEGHDRLFFRKALTSSPDAGKV